MSKTKICSVCGEEKTLDQYYLRKRDEVKNPGKTYYRSACKSCSTAMSHNYREKNRQAVKKRQLETYNANKQKYQKKAREWYDAHKDQILSSEKTKKRKRVWHNNNRDRVRESIRKYKRVNIDKVRVMERKRRLKLRTELRGAYIRDLVRRDLVRRDIKIQDIPDEIIRICRQRILLKRKLKSIRDEQLTNS